MQCGIDIKTVRKPTRQNRCQEQLNKQRAFIVINGTGKTRYEVEPLTNTMYRKLSENRLSQKNRIYNCEAPRRKQREEPHDVEFGHHWLSYDTYRIATK